MNRQTFEVLILGCASAIPTSERNTTAQLINICERHFLVDCGEGTQMQMRKFKARFQNITDIFISHMHGDHIFGLPGLLNSMHLLGRKTNLTIHCPPPMKDIMDVINSTSETRFNFTIIWKFTDPGGFNLVYSDPKVEVYSFPLKHRIACTGFLFREKPLLRKIEKEKLQALRVSVADIHRLRAGEDVTDEDGNPVKNSAVTSDPPRHRSYAYCSDTIYDERIVEYIKGADLIYHESTFLEEHADRAKATYHSTAAQAAKIAQLAGAGKLVLGHFSARYTYLGGFLDEAKPVFGNTEIAADGTVLKV